jgi:hypothetical protein
MPRSCLLVLALGVAVQALNIPQNARRINVYGVGTLIDGYGLQAVGQENVIVDPVLGALEASAALWELHMDVLLRNNKQSAPVDAAAVEAARKLVTNHVMVLRDVTNSMPRTQLELVRVARVDAPFADAALREVSRLLLGCPGELAPSRPASADEAAAWSATVAYMLRRMQASQMECPGRDPDMSEGASAALRAALLRVDEIAKAAAA